MVGEPLLGWRLWRVTEEEDGPVLRSTYKNEVIWPGGAALHAECLCSNRDRQVHEPPGFGVGRDCGIYAVRAPEETAAWWGYEPRSARCGKVIGRVKLWGKVIRYEKGFKAEYAYPSELKLVGVSSDVEAAAIAVGLRERYGVPVEVELA